MEKCEIKSEASSQLTVEELDLLKSSWTKEQEIIKVFFLTRSSSVSRL